MMVMFGVENVVFVNGFLILNGVMFFNVVFVIVIMIGWDEC